MSLLLRCFLIVQLFILLSACGGGSSSDNNPVQPTPTPPTQPPAPVPPAPDPTPEPDVWEAQVDASRLLSQATFGSTKSAIDEVVEMGPEAWIDAQIALPATSHLDHLVSLDQYLSRDDMWREQRMEAWWNASLYGDDQLRQRVAFALSEIMVISENSIFNDDLWGMTNYYDMLADNAFANYRELIEEVTLSPIMGMYLSMLGNEKPDESRNIRPDENYARELMQLFAIGLVELNLDGTQRLDANGETIPTYDQEDIEAYAHVYTGWNFNGTEAREWYRFFNNYNTLQPMTAVDEFHDKSEKELLGGVIVPANQTAEEDLAIALDSLFMHPNVGPFISTGLIKRLVTSNPTPDYIERVATVFNDNGNGVRGDLGAVIKALLLDPEARSGHQSMGEGFGKLREPIIKATHLWRAFNGQSPNGRIQFAGTNYFFNQTPLGSPSVFNFFLPTFTKPGVLTDAELVAPELQIMTETYVVRTTNFFAYTALWGHSLHNEDPEPQDILVDYATEITMLDDYDELIGHLNLILMSGSMTDVYQDALRESLDATQTWEPADQVANLVFLIMSSPQYSVQR